MSEIIAIVSNPYGEGDNGVRVTASQTSAPPNSIENMLDVDLQSLNDGSVLVYKVSTSKWTATRVLESQDITGGQY